jgi:hypothetical protein
MTQEDRAPIHDRLDSAIRVLLVDLLEGAPTGFKIFASEIANGIDQALVEQRRDLLPELLSQVTRLAYSNKVSARNNAWGSVNNAIAGAFSVAFAAIDLAMHDALLANGDQ